VDEREYTLIEHLTDLRKRIVRAAIGVAAVAFVALGAADQLIVLLREPLEAALADVSDGKAQFVVIAPAEYFIAKLKAAMVAGLFVASPWVLYQLWLFVAPGLYPHERRWVTAFVWAGAFFFCAGGVFAYTLVFPGMFRFFLADTVAADVAMTLSVAEHLSFSLKLLVAFGVVFQAPVLVFVLSMAGIVDPKTLAKYRSYVVVAGFIIGAILTPPDIFSQALLAIPLIVLFELGIWVSVLVMKFRGTPISREARAAADAQRRAEKEAAASEDAA